MGNSFKKKNQYKTEVIDVQCGSKGHDYDSLFGKYLDMRVKKVEIHDPYIRLRHQLLNLVDLCELLLAKTSVTNVHLVTSQDHESSKKQNEGLKELKKSLRDTSVNFTYEYSPTLHDRCIKLDNGWSIMMGRGLDIYKNPGGSIVIGTFNRKLRVCHQFTITILHQSTVK